MRLFFLAFIAALFSSCASLYIPNKPNAPLLSQKGEKVIEAAMGTHGIDVQGAIAVNDNIVVMLNTSFGNSNSSGSGDSHSHIFGEAGVGYFRSINTNGIFDIYGGAEWANSSSISSVTFSSGSTTS